ncbi:MAG: hypothetical protein JWQ69_4497 [Pseudomonas sp.]|nr:hypothetical protein [Pseudomonas sp.]
MSDPSALFHRPQLAQQFASRILKTGGISAAASGTFLSAPRRTGKSTFVREDLRPALQNMGALVLYVDLWENTGANPGHAIVNTIRAELGRHEGIIARIAKNAGMATVKVGGFQFDLDKVGLGADASVSIRDALVALSEETKMMIVLIIDEAQQALTTTEGESALLALKAARDELNSSAQHGLRIVCTGSNRVKLAMMVNSKDQAFYGAHMVNFPSLGQDFIDWFCSIADLPFEPDPLEVMQLFEDNAYRPEALYAGATHVEFLFDASPADAFREFALEVKRKADESNAATMQLVRSLTPLQSAVLKVMAVTGTDFAPFEAGTLTLYRKALSLAGVDEQELKADVASIQTALAALQEKKLAWRASRGVYYLEDLLLVEMLDKAGLLAGLS